ncbi:MAG: acetyl-CoA synthetase, partial [Ignavibacteria bacterium CHB3]|nr:acetyl-CoA synthetase [Ignavibacteria bacterium CHB3]
MKKYFSVFIFFIFSISLFCQSEKLTRLLRFPDISKDKIAFVYAGDIWIVDASGGTARQLTSHEGIELFPKFSPDGKWIAFSAEYSGNRQVYIIPVEGGTPTQLTYYNDVGIMPPRGGFDYQVLGWTPDGKNVLFRGNRLPWGERMGKYFLVPVAGGFETPLQIPEGGGGMLSPDGTKMFDNYDVLWPSAGDDKIVYENGGYIYKYDITTNKNEMVAIKVFGDFPGTFPYIKNLSDQVNWFEISPTGKRALLEARGDVFTVPAENGEIINITQTPGIREIDPVWSPDGKWIAYLSDRTGEYEIFMKSSDGSGEEKQITNDGTIWRFSPVWSPDSKQIAFSDKNQKLWYVNVDGGSPTEVDHSNYNDITDYKWSPDSKWLTYTKSDESRMG